MTTTLASCAGLAPDVVALAGSDSSLSLSVSSLSPFCVSHSEFAMPCSLLI